MPITVIDKIKQKNNQTFKLLDAIDIQGRITGWQDPVARMVADVASIPAFADGETFILANASGTWTAFTSLDIYGRIASAENNAIYQKQTAVSDGTTDEYYLVTSPAAGMITLDKNSTKLKVYNGTAWIDLITGTGGTVSGEVLRAEAHLVVDTISDPGANYNTTTKHLTIGMEIMENDNVNVYVNGMKYSHDGANNAITFTPGANYLVWIPQNAGFDLIDDDEVEVEIFNNE